MGLTADQVKKVARLANLPIDDIQLNQYSEQLSKILDYVAQLNQVDTSDVEATFNPTGNTNVTREDIVSTSLTQTEATSNGQVKDGLFVTKGVFGEE